MKYYAGIGSRETPPEILTLMKRYALLLRDRGWRLRSGGARGADMAFIVGSQDPDSEVYLPWTHYNNFRYGTVCGNSPNLRAIAAQHHPMWSDLPEGAQYLHARNTAIVLGREPGVSSKSAFVLCWTPNASGSGGTGQAIRVARAYGILVYDLADANNGFEKDWL